MYNNISATSNNVSAINDPVIKNISSTDITYKNTSKADNNKVSAINKPINGSATKDLVD